MPRKISGADRARRMIALFARLTPGTRIRMSDLATDLDVPVSELAADLSSLTLCGAPPYYPDDCISLIFEGEFVTVSAPLPALAGAVRLSATEARALVAALLAAGLGPSSPLVAKLVDATASHQFDGDELAHTIRTAGAAHASDVYQVLASAVAGHMAVRITHSRAGGEEASERLVEPSALFVERGHWYLAGWCREAGDWRTFRLDRIQHAELTAESCEPSARPGFVAGPTALAIDGLPAATLRLGADTPFSEREWPGGRVITQSEAGTTVQVPYAGTSWIARRIVARLGSVEVLAPQEVRDAVAACAKSLTH